MTHTIKHSIATASLIAATVVMAAPAAAAPGRELGMPATAAAAQPGAGARALAPQSDAQRYAERERATPQLANFRGGDTVVIGASAVAVILAIVLILVLI
jgi:hypothetical protein